MTCIKACDAVRAEVRIITGQVTLIVKGNERAIDYRSMLEGSAPLQHRNDKPKAASSLKGHIPTGRDVCAIRRPRL